MKKGKLYTSYFAKLKYGIGLKISIARYNPKWLTDKYIDDWLRGLAPSPELLNKYKYDNLSWDEYEDIYRSEIGTDVSPIDFKILLELLDKGQDVTVYCYEKPTDHCHRHILADIVKSLGYETEEIQ